MGRNYSHQLDSAIMKAIPIKVEIIWQAFFLGGQKPGKSSTWD